MIPTAVVEPSGRVLVARLIGWQDIVLLVVGVLLLVLARFIVYRRRRIEELRAGRVPLIDVPTPAPPGQPPRPVWPPAGQTAQPPARRGAPSHPPARVPEELSEQVQAGPVRFHRPPEGTLQLLPGRLEIVSGNEGVDAIRFVKVPGKEALVTFGRSPGEPHRHIELQSPTVSRKHAAMRFDNGSWHIANLSTTNPVVVRGRQLTVNDAPIRLEDGDQVEMGEVTFRFHGRAMAPSATAARQVRAAKSELQSVRSGVAKPVVTPAVESNPVIMPAEPEPPVPHPVEPEPPVPYAVEPEPVIAIATAEPVLAVAARPEPVVIDAADAEPAVARKPEVELLVTGAADAELVTSPAVVDAVILNGAADDLFDRPAEAMVSSRAQRAWSAATLRGAISNTASRAHTLTRREIEIVHLVVDRKSNHAIGEALDISPRTVSTHLTNIYRKLDVTSRGKLAEYVARHGVA